MTVDSVSEKWWPPGYTSPAFQVQRQVYGAVVGGDYVRGSAVTTLPQTAIRFASQVKGFDAIKDKAILDVRPWDYSTVQVMWGWPAKVVDTWQEVSLVRSVMGRPSTPNDGVTVFRAKKGSPEAGLYTLDGEVYNAPVIYDRPLQPGRWYYYTVFFRTTPIEWVVGMQDSTPLPRNYHHAEHLWDRIPPFYQWTDDNQREGIGFLRQFLTVFGFELDTERELIEQWQNLYHTDFAPMKLLRRLGVNFGIGSESGLGDIRYRSYLAKIADFYAERGTSSGLSDVIEATSHYDVELSPGVNMMMLPDDSEFLTGTGDWSTLDPTTITPTATRAIESEVTLATDSATAPPASAGRGTMIVNPTKAAETKDLIIACGDGVIDTRSLIPLYNGIAVREASVYGFSISLKMEAPLPVTRVGILWFDGDGQPTDALSDIESASATPSDTNWHSYTITGAAPAGVGYLVPFIWLSGRTASGFTDRGPYLWTAGAMVYLLGDSATATSIAPDRYLTMGDPAETIGPPDATHPGYLMGQ